MRNHASRVRGRATPAVMLGAGISRKAAANYDAVVAEGGSGACTNLHSALAAAPDNGSNVFVIFIKPGTYQGQIIVPKTKRHLHFAGADTEKAILTCALNQTEPGRAFQTDPAINR